MTPKTTQTETNTTLPTTFDELGLSPELLQGVQDAGFTHCTAIQAKALPPALAGHDVAGQAQTGTGKTAAFLLALMTRLLRSEAAHANADSRAAASESTEPASGAQAGPGVRTQPRAVVLAPTRELAIQIYKDALVLGAHTGLRFGVVYGGTGYVEQREMVVAGLDVLIGTPGRLIDYFKQKLFDLQRVEVVVLDEADRMFDLGFIKDIRFVLRRMPAPEQRLNLLFSATMSYRVTELAYEHMNGPTVVNVNPEQITVDEVRQILYHVSKDEKLGLLVGLLRRMEVTRTIVFINTKHMAERVADCLEANGFKAGLLSGDVPQRKRMALLNQFKDGTLPILVATDVAARGLHIEEVSHVFNFDLPQDAEDYVHRIGRTARAGATGSAVSFACEEYVFSLQEIEEFIGQTLPSEFVDDTLLAEYVEPPRRARRRRGERPGQRPSGPGGQRRGRGRAGASRSDARSEPVSGPREPTPPTEGAPS